MTTFTFKPGIRSCPLCNTEEPKEAMLIKIANTEEGSNVQELQVHTQCLSDQLWFYPPKLIIAIPK